jgi:DNA-binding transcriptional LysR family regulator
MAGLANSPVAASSASKLLRGGDAALKAHALPAAQHLNQATLDIRRPRSTDRPHKPSLAAQAIGLDSLVALNIFVRAAETCSFTDAGRQLGLSSSAVGKCVARLEQRLSVRLFHRNTRCITPTHEGKAFLESCRRIFSELRSVEDELAQTKGAPKGKLRVSMPLNGMLMVPTLGDFIRAYPEVDLDIDFTDSFVDVVDGGYDVVLRSGEVSDSRLKSRRLGTYQFEVVGSPNYFAHAGKCRSSRRICLSMPACTASTRRPASCSRGRSPRRQRSTTWRCRPPRWRARSTLSFTWLRAASVSLACRIFARDDRSQTARS